MISTFRIAILTQVFFFFFSAKEPKPCIVDGNTLKDGEEYKPDCRRLCTCQDGQFSCTTLCPQEERKPSIVHCKEPKLIEISNKCCKEWTCPVQHDDIFPDLPSKSGEYLHFDDLDACPPVK